MDCEGIHAPQAETLVTACRHCGVRLFWNPGRRAYDTANRPVPDWRWLNLRNAQVAKQRIEDDRKAARRFRAVNRVFWCASCGAPVADNGPSRLRHAQRSVKCGEAMGL